MPQHVKEKNEGFVGLIALLIMVCISAVLLVMSLKSSLGPVSVLTSTGTGTTTAENPIQAAQNVKKLIERQNQRNELK